jgi:hypothetical protein
VSVTVVVSRVARCAVSTGAGRAIPGFPRAHAASEQMAAIANRRDVDRIIASE